jgi:hypothetical protein
MGFHLTKKQWMNEVGVVAGLLLVVAGLLLVVAGLLLVVAGLLLVVAGLLLVVAWLLLVCWCGWTDLRYPRTAAMIHRTNKKTKNARIDSRIMEAEPGG